MVCVFGPWVGSSPRPISTSQLNGSHRLHLWPIYLVIYKGSYQLLLWETSSWGWLRA